MEEKLFESVVGLGFPSLVAGFCLIRLERELKSLARAIDGLKRCQVCILKDNES